METTYKTRVFVNGLPPNLTNQELSKHFSTRYGVTDAHVMPKRRMGFVGFETQEAAEAAVKYFNRSFIRMSRISVDMALPVENGTKDHSTGDRASNGKRMNDDASKSQSSKPNGDPSGKSNDKLEEYLAIMQPPKKSRTWADDGLNATVAPPAVAAEPRQEPETTELPQRETKRRKIDRPEQVGSIPSARPHDAHKVDPLQSTEQTREAPNQTSGEECVEDETGLNITPLEVEDKNEAKTDADWLRSKTSRLLGLLDDDEQAEMNAPVPERKTESESSDDEADGPVRNIPDASDSKPEAQPAEPVEEVDTNIDMIRNTGRLFIRNLPYQADEAGLESVFSPFGKLEEVHVAFDSRSTSSKGFAYVQYVDPDSAVVAYQTLDKSDYQGRLLHILPASAKKTYKLDDYEISKLPLKKQKQIKRKAEATSSTFSWNSLYMNADAVMSSVAERLGVPKAQLLDPTSSDAAVKQAHAETHVIQETKAYFTSNGVNLDSFKTRAKGDTAILVKNFSFGVKADDLRKLFEPYGQITRLIMPPTGTIAIVEFSRADEAQKSFKGLAYRKIGDSILFLERAPKDLFDGTVAPTVTTAGPSAVSQGFSTSDAFRAEEPEERLETSTLFVRNLNFITTNSRLTEVFEPLDGFLSARVKTKSDPKKPGQTLSMGFGFIEFRTGKQAQAALAAMNGYKLDQHELVIKTSHKGMDSAEVRRREDNNSKSAAKRTKIIIKNLPFQATKKDVRSLFGAYGQLRSVRVPQKYDRSTRGFAFADFVSAREAENAMDALRDSHLLGRRLVLEFTTADSIDPEEEIQKIEKKVGRQVDKVNLKKLTGSGRKKFNVGAQDNEED